MLFSLEGYLLIWSWFSRDPTFVCLLLPENVIICDKRPSKCGTWAKFNDLKYYYILRFYYILRCIGLNAKCDKKINAKCNKNLSAWYLLVVWSKTVGYDLEMFSITHFY